MKNKIKEKWIIILIISVIIFLFIIFYFTLKQNRKLTFIERGLKDTSVLISKIFYIPVEFVSDKIDEHNDKKNIYKKYEKQKKKIDNYNNLEAENAELNKRIKELEGLLSIKSNLADYESIEASVINRNVGYWYQIMTIDKGTDDGIKENMAVITKDGLIGKIATTTKYNSVVKLLTSINSSFQISVKIENENNEIYGLLSGYDDSKNLFKIEGISDNSEIKLGSKVTTTGLDNIFPSGINIGTVEKITMDNFDLAKTIYLKSSSSFDDIKYVSVLKRVVE